MPIKSIPEKLIHKDKLEKESKEHKEKLEKENKEHKESKDHKDVKEHGKLEHKEIYKVEYIETLPVTTDPGGPVEANVAGASNAPATEEKAGTEPIYKAHVDKLYKVEVPEKQYTVEKFRPEKYVYEYYPQLPVTIPDPGPVEQRVAALEATVAQLTHFIPQELRPDLTKGALKQEPTAGDTKTEDKK